MKPKKVEHITPGFGLSTEVRATPGKVATRSITLAIVVCFDFTTFSQLQAATRGAIPDAQLIKLILLIAPWYDGILPSSLILPIVTEA